MVKTKSQKVSGAIPSFVEVTEENLVGRPFCHLPILNRVEAYSSNVPDYQHKFHCSVCTVNLSLSGGGANNLQKHSETPAHNKLANALQGNNLT